MSGVSARSTRVPVIKPVTHCRVCGGDELSPWFSLGDQPLANALLDSPDAAEDTYPLVVLRCRVCGLSQLSVVVPPGILYANYPYISGASPSWHVHCQGMVAIVQEHYPNAKRVLDIASNDGTLLDHFADAGYGVLGVDPADNLTSQCKVPTVTAFWGERTARGIVRTHGQYDVVIAQNVLGHVDDVLDFLRGVWEVLDRGGVALIEVPDLFMLLGKTAFDTIYHEHLSYWALTPLVLAAQRAGLRVVHWDALAVHGGSMRVWLKHAGPQDLSVVSRLSDERRGGLLESGKYKQFAARVDVLLRRLQEILETLQAQGKVIWGYGCPAKGNVLLNALDANGSPLPEILVEDAATKVGKFSPGAHIPIQVAEDVSTPDVLMLLPWNVAPTLKERARVRGFTGQFLTPIPQPTLEDA